MASGFIFDFSIFLRLRLIKYEDRIYLIITFESLKLNLNYNYFK